MVKQLAGLAILALGGWTLLQRQGGGSAPATTDNPRAFGWAGIPYSPEEFDRQSETWGGPLDLGFMDRLFPTGPVEDTSAAEGGTIFDLINGTGDVWDMTKPRGIRNHNPGNIEYTGTQWQGLDEPPSDGRFMRFVDPVYGIRAMARVLETYRNRHDLRTVGSIIQRWAPGHENNTNAYIRAVADKLGVGPAEEFDVIGRRDELIDAIIHHENGQQPYPMALIREGVALA